MYLLYGALAGAAIGVIWILIRPPLQKSFRVQLATWKIRALSRQPWTDRIQSPLIPL